MLFWRPATVQVTTELRQEFSSSQRKLVKIWTVDASDRLSVTERIESLTFNSKDSTAVFVRQ